MDIEEAKNARKSTSAVYTEFMLDFKKSDECIFCFFEGSGDFNYYSNRIKILHVGFSYFNYECNGKEGVWRIFNRLQDKQHYKYGNIGYFVDSDFDGKTLPDEIYTTPFYSIENFYVVTEAFESILLNEFKIPRNCDCFDIAIQKYSDLKQKFHKDILSLNAWLACHADYRKISQNPYNLNIESQLKKVIKPSDFDKIVNSKLELEELPLTLLTYEGIESVFNDVPNIKEDDFKNKIDELKNVNYDECFRGKFELRFLISFLNRFKEEVGKKNSSMFPIRYKTSLRFEYSTALSQLTDNAITPKCLKKYITGIVKANSDVNKNDVLRQPTLKLFQSTSYKIKRIISRFFKFLDPIKL